MSNKINDKINLSLESLNDLNRLSPNPFLLTRIHAALTAHTAQNIWTKIAFYLKKPSIAIAAILLLLLVNVIVISNRNKTIERDAVSKTIGLQTYDFAINVAVIYDTENLEPQ